MNREFALATTLAIAATLAATALAGCGTGAHEIVDFTEDCTSCHDEKPTYGPVGDVASATQVGTTVTISSKAATVSVCEVTFISEDCSKFAPSAYKTVYMSEGSGQIELSEGYWALCTGENGTDSQKLIKVVDGGPTDAVEV